MININTDRRIALENNALHFYINLIARQRGKNALHDLAKLDFIVAALSLFDEIIAAVIETLRWHDRTKTRLARLEANRVALVVTRNEESELAN